MHTIGQRDPEAAAIVKQVFMAKRQRRLLWNDLFARFLQRRCTQLLYGADASLELDGYAVICFVARLACYAELQFDDDAHSMEEVVEFCQTVAKKNNSRGERPTPLLVGLAAGAVNDVLMAHGASGVQIRDATSLMQPIASLVAGVTPNVSTMICMCHHALIEVFIHGLMGAGVPRIGDARSLATALAIRLFSLDMDGDEKTAKRWAALVGDAAPPTSWMPLLLAFVPARDKLCDLIRLAAGLLDFLKCTYATSWRRTQRKKRGAVAGSLKANIRAGLALELGEAMAVQLRKECTAELRTKPPAWSAGARSIRVLAPVPAADAQVDDDLQEDDDDATEDMNLDESDVAVAKTVATPAAAAAGDSDEVLRQEHDEHYKLRANVVGITRWMALKYQDAEAWTREQLPAVLTLHQDLSKVHQFLTARGLEGIVLPFIPQKGSRADFMGQKPSQKAVLRQMFDLHLLIVALRTDRASVIYQGASYLRARHNR
jgi:hypothetical protein